ncbi:hypothetical protein ACIQUF_03400 [Pseudomonas sp. NPDC090233]|uniref:hypothetical protein n=1 Tax=Pseudomonas sp. NPDC090233 TaxID=3364479 RepID=UPI00383A816F
MNFTHACQTYINNNLYDEHDKILKDIGRRLPTGPANIHWEEILEKFEIPAVTNSKLKEKIFTIAKLVGIKETDPIIIINIEDGFPALQTTLKQWSAFSEELDYPNTVFFDVNTNKIIHWDFYKDLYATSMPIKK